MDPYGIGASLANKFATILYPAVVILVFSILVLVLFVIVCSGTGYVSVIRRIIGTILPLVLLVILVASGNGLIVEASSEIDRLHVGCQFLVGAVVGELLMESSHWFLKQDSDGAAGLYAFLIFCLASFMLWAVMAGTLGKFNSTLIGFVLAAGLHVIFRGVPSVLRHKEP